MIGGPDEDIMATAAIRLHENPCQNLNRNLVPENTRETEGGRVDGPGWREGWRREVGVGLAGHQIGFGGSYLPSAVEMQRITRPERNNCYRLPEQDG